MAILMKHDNDIDKMKYLADEEKIERKKQNKGETICPIMSPQIIQWSGDYAVCIKELCALWDDGRCTFCKSGVQNNRKPKNAIKRIKNALNAINKKGRQTW